MEKRAMAERRRLERFQLSAPARLIIESHGDENSRLNLTTKDVSSGGAFLYCAQPLGEGARVKMELRISRESLSRLVEGDKGTAKIEVKGEVVRVDPDGIAIRFESRYMITALDESDRENGPL
jgi:hypothetical protein